MSVTGAETVRVSHGSEADVPAKGDLVQSFSRGLAVIRAFSELQPELTLTEVAATADITRAAARRFLITLIDLGYVATDGRRYWLRPSILDLGNAYLASLGLGDIARPHMERLVADAGESSALCILSGDEIAYVALARVPLRRMAFNVDIGTRIPAYPSAMGRVLLAGQSDEWIAGYFERNRLEGMTPFTVDSAEDLTGILDGVRRDRYAVVDRELDIGLHAIAVPVCTPAGACVAALNLSTLGGQRNDLEMRDDLLPLLRRTAAEIELDLAAIVRRRSAMAFEVPRG
jgi:IclR family transcriptional regulator, pca regulon regulatory protein